MGPMFYLVQCEEARCLISAVLLADWPRESFPRPTSGPCAEPVGRFGLRFPPPARRGLLRSEKKAWREIRAIWTVRALLC